MCIFTDEIEFVSGTKIFGRIQGAEQVLVYEMSVSSSVPLAMVLPLPVATGSGESAVRFMNMESYPAFFAMLESLFPVTGAAQSETTFETLDLAASATLEVFEVGAFEASFVPELQDFRRLDPRFRLDDAIWEQLPAYGDFGFAVFQLVAGTQNVHPMAFAFPTRFPQSIFFPTVHVHDSSVHAEAHFDHALYAQPAADTSAPAWQKASLMPGTLEWHDVGSGVVGVDGDDVVDVELVPALDSDAALIDPPEALDVSRPCYRRRIFGRAPNEDIYL